jgi:parallel beta-helix repeat protein
MQGKLASILLLFFLLVSTIVLAHNIQPVKSDYTWTQTIHIQADGSIQPPTAPISSVDNVTYTLTDNITSDADGIVIEKDNLTLDGAGYVLQGANMANSFTGVELSGRNNVTIKNMTITGFYDGFYFNSSANNKVSGNCITANNGRGIFLLYSPSNILNQNNITRNGEGVFIGYSSNNDLTDNVFLENEYNLGVFAETADDSLQNIDTSNTVDGQPIYYWVNRTGGVIPSNAGYVAIVNSQNITVEGLSLSHNDQGILLAYSTNTTIKDNKLTDSVYGVSVVGGATNRITQNNMTNNTYGTGFRYSSNNSLSENTFSNNTCGVLLIYSSDDNSITGNNLVENQDGIDLTSADHNLITQNNITANNGQGIRLTIARRELARRIYCCLRGRVKQ